MRYTSMNIMINGHKMETQPSLSICQLVTPSLTWGAEACRSTAWDHCHCVPGPCRDLWRGRCSKYKGAHRTQLLIGLCSLLICVSKWMLLYWYSSKCHDTGSKKKHRTEKTILSLLLWNYIIIIIIIVVVVIEFTRYGGFAVVKTLLLLLKKKYSCLI